MYYFKGRPHYYYANHKVNTDTKAAGVALIIFAIVWLLMSLPVVIGSMSEVGVPDPCR